MYVEELCTQFGFESSNEIYFFPNTVGEFVSTINKRRKPTDGEVEVRMKNIVSIFCRDAAIGDYFWTAKFYDLIWTNGICLTPVVGRMSVHVFIRVLKRYADGNYIVSTMCHS